MCVCVARMCTSVSVNVRVSIVSVCFGECVCLHVGFFCKCVPVGICAYWRICVGARLCYVFICAFVCRYAYLHVCLCSVSMCDCMRVFVSECVHVGVGICVHVVVCLCELVCERVHVCLSNGQRVQGRAALSRVLTSVHKTASIY